MSKSCLIIEGPAEEISFRPHNWAERLAGNLASYGKDRRLRFSEALMPVMINDVKCLRVCPTLESKHPSVFDEVIRFAKGNDLNIQNRAAQNREALSIAS
jgi:hypothetical protein